MTHLQVPASTRTEAVTYFRKLRLKERRDMMRQYAGLTYVGGDRMTHTMAWNVVNQEPRK